jgi:GTPase SAR1 family protein
MPTDNISIAVIGTVSAGKSTFGNSAIGQDIAESNYDRTTTITSALIETTDSGLIDSISTAKKIIEAKNRRIYNDTEGGADLDLKLHGTELVIYINRMIWQLCEFYNITLYDIPGLDDGKTKLEYIKYFEENSYKFNMILFIVEIESGLSKEGEMEILREITSNIAKQKKNGKNIKLFVVANKADNMSIESSTNKLVIDDEKLRKQFIKIENTVKRELVEIGLDPIDTLIGCVPISAQDAHMYRMIQIKGSKYKLTDKQQQLIGKAAIGNSFGTQSASEKEKIILDIISNKATVASALKLTGFENLESMLRNYLYSCSNGQSCCNKKLQRISSELDMFYYNIK